MQCDELSLGSSEIRASEGTGGHTVDRWKRKEAIKTIAGYAQALSPLGLAAVESLEKNVLTSQGTRSILKHNFFPLWILQKECSLTLGTQWQPVFYHAGYAVFTQTLAP